MTCTITNKRKARLKVVKKLDPATDGGMFDLEINGVTKKVDATDSDTTGLNVAGARTSSARPGHRTTLADYDSRSMLRRQHGSAERAGPLSSANPAGDTVTCTITNERKAR